MNIANYFLKYPRFGCFLLGCISALSFAPTQNLITLIGGFLGFLWLFEKTVQSVKQGIIFYFVYAYGYYGLSLYWVSLSIIPAGHPYLAPVGMITFPLIFCILSVWIGAVLFPFKKSPCLYPFAFGCMLFIQEWIIGHAILGGFPWLLTAYAWQEWGMQISAFVGVYGLSCITLFWMGLLYKPNQIKNIIAMLILTGICGVGYMRYNLTPLEYTQTTIRIVHPNINQCDKHNQSKINDIFSCHKDLSQLPTKRNINLVVWPEAALMQPVNLYPHWEKYLSALAIESGYLIIGAPRYVQGIKPLLYTSAYIINHERIIDTYDKINLVPFGEFLPFKNILNVFGLHKLAQGALDFTPGNLRKTIKLEDIPPFVILICYEIIFSGKVLNTVGDKKPEWILNLTNDAWYLGLTGPYQHLHIARFRAVEEGIPIVRCANQGVSCVIDGVGRILKSLSCKQKGVVDIRIPKPLKMKTYFSSRK